ncbi:MAG: lanthionine synthetase C family protein, partial [Pseudonocardiaceae bacterium]
TEDILAAIPAGGFLNGLAGTALLHARLAAVDPVFARAAVRHWAAAAQNPGPHRGAAGIFSSPGGLAASLIIGSAYLPDPDSPRAATARAVRWLAARAVDLAHDREEHLRAGGVGTPWPIYDAINGLAGIGRVLLAALTAGYDTAESGLLAALRTLTAMIDTQHGRRPGWWLPAGQHSSAVTVHPSGAATTGMAHGISGPLALLALAMRQGVSVAGQAEAIGVICAWLDEWRQEGTNGPWWPEWITDADLRDHQVRRAGPHRPSWCYGTPGLARAQQLAGQAIGDTGRQHLAERALAQCLADEALLAQITDRTICHGTAGVFQTAWWAAKDATTPAIAARLPRLRILLNGTSSGGGDTESTAEGDLIDTAGNLGVLNGAAGIGLALHTATTDAPPKSRWDTCLLIA